MSLKHENSVSYLLLILSTVTAFLTSLPATNLLVTPAESFVFSDDYADTNNADTASDSPTPSDSARHIVRDSETILLGGQLIPSDDYIRVYDSSPYKIVNGHLATKIPCNDSFQPLLNILVGEAPNLQIIQLMLIEELSTPGKLCMYHADLEPSTRVAHTTPEVTIGNVTDIAIQNPTVNPIEFPPTTSLVIGVNEIQAGAEETGH